MSGEVGGGRRPVERDDLEAVGEALVEPEVVERGDELPPGEVAAAGSRPLAETVAALLERFAGRDLDPELLRGDILLHLILSM